MNPIAEGVAKAFELLTSFDPAVWAIVAVSLKVSTTAIVLATGIGVPVGILVGLSHFRGRRFVITMLNTSLAAPTVVIGLFLYALLSRSGPLGSLQILYTPAAMVLGQCLLATPIVAALSVAAMGSVSTRAMPTFLTLGATRLQALWTMIVEARFALAAAVTAAFGRVFSEVGISMMLGGNIRGHTRNITTGIAFETGKGEFGLGLALGLILIVLALGINIGLQILQSRGRFR